MKRMKKIVSVLLAGGMLLAAAAPAAGAETTDYSIANPYETVDWDGWGRYKSQLHTHTYYSDGTQNITDVAEAYYAQDYDILAVTDHGVVNTGWNTPNKMIPIISGFNAIGKPGAIHPMSDERYREITTGADRGGRPMLDVKLGIEMNALNVRKNHVNGYFCGWGQGYLGREENYETSIAETEKAGGISVINHPGDFFHANEDINRAYDWNNVMIFADSLLAHPSCVGVEAFNGADTADRYDRIVWDHLLMFCIPRGRNVLAFSNDDSHYDYEIGRTAEIMLMPELSEAALRTAMETGTFFACSRFARLEMGESFEGNGNYAQVDRITVDDANDVISVQAENYDAIEWVADGEVIATGDTLRLREHADEIGAYVRFQIKNEGGLLLSQAFICDDGDMESHLIAAPEQETHPWIVQKILDILAFFRKTLLGEVFYRFVVLERRLSC